MCPSGVNSSTGFSSVENDNDLSAGDDEFERVRSDIAGGFQRPGTPKTADAYWTVTTQFPAWIRNDATLCARNLLNLLAVPEQRISQCIEQESQALTRFAEIHERARQFLNREPYPVDIAAAARDFLPKTCCISLIEQINRRASELGVR